MISLFDMGKLSIFMIVVFVSVVTVIGDYFIKISGESKDKVMLVKPFALGLFFYILTAFGWFFIMKNLKLSSIGFVYGVTTAGLLALIGFFIFNEHLNSIEILGIFFAMLAMVMLIRFAS